MPDEESPAITLHQGVVEWRLRTVEEDVKCMQHDLTALSVKIDERALTDAERRIEDANRSQRLFIGIVFNGVVVAASVLIQLLHGMVLH
ncbi:MAG: hypothetical protein KGL39_09000 [Patescibacteria group bacterium]|nr:hypothetical protein [Patescibacteria group bacterium]